MAIFSKGKRENEFREKCITYKRVFGSPEGKKVLYDLMDRNHVVATHKGDIFQEGRRAAILEIMYFCNISVKQLDEMMKGETNE